MFTLNIDFNTQPQRSVLLYKFVNIIHLVFFHEEKFVMKKSLLDFTK